MRVCAPGVALSDKLIRGTFKEYLILLYASSVPNLKFN
jgi:hypothetical protein